MNKTHAALTLATVVAAGLALSGCAQHDATPSTQKTVVSHPSYAESFASLDEMSTSADIIVHGTVTAAAPGEPLGDIVTSTYTFTVDNWIKGTPTSNIEVTVFQTGGIKGDTTYVTEDDPLMHVGEEAVLYLDEAIRASSTPSPDQPAASRSPTGRSRSSPAPPSPPRSRPP